jgi:glycosyltransferase involved in cell wall biosynthesis
MEKRKKILMVVPFQSSFIKKDIEILSSHYDIVLNEYNWRNKSFVPLFMIMQVFAMLRHIFFIKSVIIQFGGYWSLIPSIIGKIFKVPVFIILHGTDSALMPGINYGSLRKKPLRIALRLSYQFASMLLPVSSSLLRTENDYNPGEVMQGINYHFPKLKTPARVISNGLATEFWTPPEKGKKDIKSFITVFYPAQFMRKGGDMILLLAKRYPDCNFYIAGSPRPQHISEIPVNVHYLGKISQAELRENYLQARFYLQLSMFEGFGLALCEAMLCECIPIVSSANILPEIIGDTGYVVTKKDIDLLASVVEKALQAGNKEELGEKARARIIEKYSLDNRLQILRETIESS